MSQGAASAADWWWVVPLMSFIGGSVAAWGLQFVVTNWINYPIISVRLDEKKGSTGEVTVTSFNNLGDVIEQHQAKFIRLYVENTGRATIKECSGYITKLTRTEPGAHETKVEGEVIDLGWAHQGHSSSRDIPSTAFFHLDVATLHLLPSGKTLTTPRGLPSTTSLRDFFKPKATYELEVQIFADNARLHESFPVKFDYDPASRDEIKISPLSRVRLPWWRRQPA
jgi:hypothetical protein